MQSNAHSLIGASAAYRWFNCPGSVRLLTHLPERESSIYAEEGTAAHELAELCLNDTTKQPDFFIGKKINDIEVTQDMVDAVRIYLDFITEQSNKIGGSLLIEKKFKLDWIDEDLYGTCDAVVYSRDVLRVYDYKHGAGVAVDVKDNKQLMYYALGFWHGTGIEDIEIGIIQPRAYHPDGPIRTIKLTGAELSDFAVQVQYAVERTRAEDPFFSCGDWCKFCDAKTICKKFREDVVDKCLDAFSTDASGKYDPIITPKDLCEHLKNISILKIWIKEMEQLAVDSLKNDAKIPQYRLKKRRNRSTWSDEKMAEKELFSLFGDEIYETKLKSPTKIKKLDLQFEDVEFDNLIKDTTYNYSYEKILEEA